MSQAFEHICSLFKIKLSIIFILFVGRIVLHCVVIFRTQKRTSSKNRYVVLLLVVVFLISLGHDSNEA